MAFETRVALDVDFSVPPGEANSQWHAIAGFKKETMIYDLTPHMHLRGSWFKYEALYPDGNREVLLSVPRYDFNWQTEYRLSEPKRMPAGTWLLCTGGYDNSKTNPNNPDFTKRIHHGEQSFDEMFMGFMNVAEVPAAEEKKLQLGRIVHSRRTLPKSDSANVEKVRVRMSMAPPPGLSFMIVAWRGDVELL